MFSFFFFFQAEDGIRDLYVTGVQTCALPISTGSLAVTSRLESLSTVENQAVDNDWSSALASGNTGSCGSVCKLEGAKASICCSSTWPSSMGVAGRVSSDSASWSGPGTEDTARMMGSLGMPAAVNKWLNAAGGWTAAPAAETG